MDIAIGIRACVAFGNHFSLSALSRVMARASTWPRPGSSSCSSFFSAPLLTTSLFRPRDAGWRSSSCSCSHCACLGSWHEAAATTRPHPQPRGQPWAGWATSYGGASSSCSCRATCSWNASSWANDGGAQASGCGSWTCWASDHGGAAGSARTSATWNAASGERHSRGCDGRHSRANGDGYHRGRAVGCANGNGLRGQRHSLHDRDRPGTRHAHRVRMLVRDGPIRRLREDWGSGGEEAEESDDAVGASASGDGTTSSLPLRHAVGATCCGSASGGGARENGCAQGAWLGAAEARGVLRSARLVCARAGGGLHGHSPVREERSRRARRHPCTGRRRRQRRQRQTR